MGPRMSMFSPMMAPGMNPMAPGLTITAPSPMPWSQPGSPSGMMNPMFPMVPPNADPMLLAAHQQAMMVAKQAFQMAFAPQALAAIAADLDRAVEKQQLIDAGIPEITYPETLPVSARREDIAEAIRWVASLPKHMNIDTMNIMPRDQA